MRTRSSDAALRYALRHRESLKRIPNLLLPEHGDESEIVRQLTMLVLGNPTDKVPECGVLTLPAEAGYASAMYLGNQWAITAGHAVALSGGYQVSLPVEAVAEIKPGISFDVRVVKNPSADLALLCLNQDPGIPGIPLASVTEFAQAQAMQLCGFGSDNCDAPLRAGVRRLSDPFTVAPGPSATNFVISNTAAPLLCLGDSGGGSLIPFGDSQFKLAGIISGEIFTESGQPVGAGCVRLSPFFSWILSVTGIPVP